jgi:hypothetical protein
MSKYYKESIARSIIDPFYTPITASELAQDPEVRKAVIDSLTSGEIVDIVADRADLKLTQNDQPLSYADWAKDPTVIRLVLKAVSGMQLWQTVVGRWFGHNRNLIGNDFELAMLVRHISSSECPIDSPLNPLNRYRCEHYDLNPIEEIKL